MNVSQPIRSIELRHLRDFVAVAEAGSLSKAAEILLVSQPYLTKQIKSLEKKLKAELFDRTKRPHELNQAGAVLLEEAKAILTKLERAADEVHRIGLGRSGYLKVSFTSSMANGILPSILREFQERYPDVELILSEENTAEQIQRIQERQTDIMFFYEQRQLSLAEVLPGDNRSSLADLKMMAIEREMLVVVLPEHHRLANRSTIALSELQIEKFIMPDEYLVPGLSERIREIFTEAQVEMEQNITQTAVFMVTILGLVAGEMGISILPDSVQNLQRQGVVYRPIATPKTADRLCVVWRSDDTSQIVKNFLEIVAQLSTLD